MSKHILLVDDELNFRYGAAIALRMSGYEISEASDGLQALSMILKGGQFDLFIIDMRMPRMSGIELINILKKKEIKTPIIGITAYEDNLIIKELQEKGCEGFINKPFELVQFKEKIDAVLRQHKKGETGFKRFGI